MSDDDERMERAHRIRRMREGQRATDDDSEDPATEQDPEAENAVDAAEPDGGDVGDGDADTDTDGDDDADTDIDGDDDADIDTDADGDAGSGVDTQATAATDASTTAADTVTDDTVSTDDAAEHDSDRTEQPPADAAAQPQDANMNESTPTSEQDVSSETTEDEPDPQSIAQRAAQAAAEATGTASSTSESDEPAEHDQAPADGALTGVSAAATQGATGVELPDQDDIDAAIEAADGSVATAETSDAEDAPRDPGAVDSVSTTEESTRVLEFTLGDEHYCIDISLVEEIVKRDSVTRVPNTDEYIEGVVDLRGQITTILDPKALMDIDAAGSETLMIVFDPDAFDDQGALGWIVDEVQQVAPIAESEVNQPPVDEDYIRGVVDRDDSDEFVIWTKPEVAIKLATVDETDD